MLLQIARRLVRPGLGEGLFGLGAAMRRAVDGGLGLVVRPRLGFAL